MIKVIVHGAAGRMGQTIIRLISEDSDLELAFEADLGSNLADMISSADVVIDFSSAKATQDLLKVIADSKTPLVMGTTGHSPEVINTFPEVARKAPLLIAPNMSIGINLLWKLTEISGQVLGKEFPISIIEKHHVHKLDSPSGTAKKMIEVASKSSGFSPDEIPCEAIREGEIVGEHFIKFGNAKEDIELSHIAHTREIFAEGALRAAKWIVDKGPGLYDMQDVLF